MSQPSPGRPSHRLVIETPHLSWTDAIVLRADLTEVRFFSGTVRGELVEPIEQVQVGPGHIAIVGGGEGQLELSGGFLEIKTTGKSLADAELRAYAILGLIALCMGQHAVGPVRFSEATMSDTRGQEILKSILTHSYTPQEVTPIEKSYVHDRLPTYFGLNPSKKTESIVLARRWYEHGLRAIGAADSLLSHFIGVEKILASYGKRERLKSSLAALETDKDLQNLVASLRAKLDPSQISHFMNLLNQPSNAERFTHFAKHYGYPERLISRFHSVLDKRNKAIHGTASEVTDEDAEDAKTVLRALLKSELSLPSDPSWGEGPFRNRIEVRWDTESGWIATPTVDWASYLELTIPPYPPPPPPPARQRTPRPTRRRRK